MSSHPAGAIERAASVCPVMPVMHRVVRISGLFAGAATGLRSGRKNLPCEFAMQKPPLDPDVADAAPTATGYDEKHLITYRRLLD
jgi:hypothetical protein